MLTSEGDDIISTVYTIGYSGFNSTDEFVKALTSYGIKLLIDVRSSPYSAYYDQYNKEHLARVLSLNQILYRNYAKEFGARQDNHAFYPHGFLDFSLFAKSDQFLKGMQNIESAVNLNYPPVLMCAEKDPSSCHRAILIGRALHDSGYDVVHILPNHEEKSQTQIESELLDAYYPSRYQISMFENLRTDEELLDDAYMRRNQEIAYKEEKLAL